MNNLFIKKTYIQIRLIAYILIPIILLLLPSHYFDEGSVKCLSKILLDVQCPACGLTRACMRLIHLDFEGAWYFNRLSFLVFPLLCYLWASWFWRDWQKLKPRQ